MSVATVSLSSSVRSTCCRRSFMISIRTGRTNTDADLPLTEAAEDDAGVRFSSCSLIRHKRCEFDQIVPLSRKCCRNSQGSLDDRSEQSLGTRELVFIG